MDARTLLVGVTAVLAALGVSAAAPSAVPVEPRAVVAPGDLFWQLTPTPVDTRLRGLSAVSRDVAWVSGTHDTVLRTIDGGAHWSSVAPAGTAGLDYSGLVATSDRHAVVMATGSGSASRLYVTDDGGTSWALAYQNAAPEGFFDCMAFGDPTSGLVVSDPLDGAFRILETVDGGHSWTVVNPDGMPPSRPNEFGSASGSCLGTGPGRAAYLGSSGDNPQRVYVSGNGGHSWSTSDVPLAVGPSAGTQAVRFQDAVDGIAVGGDESDPNSRVGDAAWTADGGLTWHPAGVGPAGYRSGSAWLPPDRDVAVAVGPSGSDVSADAGRTWSSFDSGSFDSVECAPDGGCWASGERGRVARLVVVPG